MAKNISSVLSRRRFLVGTAAAVAGPMILPKSAWGANEKIQVGVIGIGIQGAFHLGQLSHHSANAQVVAIGEIYRMFRELGVQRCGGESKCKGYNDYRELLAREDIDAVLMAVPDHWHASMVVDAAKAGKDIYCEKPLSLTVFEARAMASAVRKYGRVFQTGSQQRSSWEFRRACELVRNGYIGKILKVTAGVGGPSGECNLPAEPVPDGLDWDRWIGPAPYRPFNAVLRPAHNNTFPNWRNYRDFSGGGMTDWGAHHFDIAPWGLGMDESGPVEVRPPNGKDVRELTYVYGNGIPLIRTGDGVVFYGTEGTVHVNRGRLDTTPESLRSVAFKSSDTRLYASDDHHGDWIQCIRSRQRPICDVEVGARSVTVCHIGNIASWLGRALKWDAKAERFVGDEEANRWLQRAYREPYRL